MRRRQPSSNFDYLGLTPSPRRRSKGLMQGFTPAIPLVLRGECDFGNVVAVLVGSTRGVGLGSTGGVDPDLMDKKGTDTLS